MRAVLILSVVALGSAISRLGYISPSRGFSGGGTLLAVGWTPSRLVCSLLCLSTNTCSITSWSGSDSACRLFLWRGRHGMVETPGSEVIHFPRTCRHLRDLGVTSDGVYRASPSEVLAVYCDQTLDGGGWTLLVTSVSRDGWDFSSVLERRADSPSLTDNYSILKHGDWLKDAGAGEFFQYRLEGEAQAARRRWGGIWEAPRHYSLLARSPDQGKTSMLERFSYWKTTDFSIEEYVPWRPMEGEFLLTSSAEKGALWGTIAMSWNTSYASSFHSPWIYPKRSSGTILYWLREEWEDFN